MAVDLKKSLRNDALGYTFCFCPKVDLYGAAAAEAILDAIEAVKLSGRCEYYAGNDLFGDGYVVGIGFRFLDSKQKATEVWWSTFIDRVEAGCTQSGTLEFSRVRSGFTDLLSIRTSLLERGAVEFHEGLPRSVLEDADSVFIGEVGRRLESGSSGLSMDDDPDLHDESASPP